MKSLLVLSIDYSVFDKWTKTVLEAIPKFPTINKVEKKQYFLILIPLIEYALDKNNYAHIVFDIKIIDPDNNIYLEKNNLEAINTQILNPQTLLSDNTIKMCFELEDKFGIYKIRVNMTDLKDNTNEIIEQDIKLIEFKFKHYFNNDEELHEWLYHYHITPTPEKIIDAYFNWVKTIKNQKKTAFPPIFAFFLEVFNNNEHLISHLKELYDSQNEETRFYIIYLLIYLKNDSNEFFKSLKESDVIMYEEILKSKGNFDPYREISSGEQLDMLWGTFFGSGKFTPIKRLIDALVLIIYNGSIDKFKEKKELTDEDREKILYDSIFRATIWSLISNCSHYDLIHNYCVYAYYKEQLSEPIRAGLKHILIESSNEWFNNALLYLEQKKSIKAIDCFLKVIDLNPNYQHAISNLGVVYLMNQEYNKGFEYLKKAIDLDPKDIQALFNLGLVLAKHGKLNEAKSHFKNLIHLEPNHVNALLNLAHVYNDKNEIPKAIEYYKKVLELDPNNSAAIKSLDAIKKE